MNLRICGDLIELILSKMNSATVSLLFFDIPNRRVKKVSGSTTTHYVWEGSSMIAEHDATTGAVTAEYIYAGGRMLAREQNGTQRYLHQDCLSVRIITNSNGVVV